MKYLVRKISKAKWQKELSAVNNIDEINHDFILKNNTDSYTSCLRTSNCTLSTWLIEVNDSNLIKELENIVLALITSLDKLDKIDLVYFSFDECSKKFILNQTEGKTPVERLKTKHYDIENLTMLQLLQIGEVYLRSLYDKQMVSFNKKAVTDIVNVAINKRILDINHVSDIKNEEVIKLLELSNGIESSF